MKYEKEQKSSELKKKRTQLKKDSNLKAQQTKDTLLSHSDVLYQ